MHESVDERQEGLATIGVVPVCLIGDDTRAMVSLLASAGRCRDLGVRAHALAAAHLSVESYLARLEDRWEQLLVDRATA